MITLGIVETVRLTMANSYDEKLCEEIRKNMWLSITDIKKEIQEIKKKVTYFNVVGIGILVSIVTGLITNLFRG